MLPKTSSSEGGNLHLEQMKSVPPHWVLQELCVGPGDFTFDTQESSTLTLNQDCEGEQHSETDRPNVESQTHDKTRVNN